MFLNLKYMTFLHAIIIIGQMSLKIKDNRELQFHHTNYKNTLCNSDMWLNLNLFFLFLFLNVGAVF